jgi:hypothetical protein
VSLTVPPPKLGVDCRLPLEVSVRTKCGLWSGVEWPRTAPRLIGQDAVPAGYEGLAQYRPLSSEQPPYEPDHQSSPSGCAANHSFQYCSLGLPSHGGGGQ